MNIVVVSPSGAALSGLEQLGRPISAFVTWSDTPVPADSGFSVVRVDRPPSAHGSGRLRSRLKGSAAGRNLLRLTPWDPGHAFARHAADQATLTATLAAADLVVAAERDAILTVWRFGRAHTPPSARLIYGMSAASNVIEAG